MDLQIIMPWLGALALFISLGNSIQTFVTSGSKKVGADLEAAKKTLVQHDRRIQTVEDEIKHLPDIQVVHDLQLTLKDLQIEMTAIRAASEQSTRISQRVENWLISNSSKADA